MPRGNPSKLQPIRTKQEASERGRKGGIASGIARKKKKTFKQLLEMIGNSTIQDAKTKALAEKLGLDPEEITYALMVNFAQFQKAIKEKDTRAAEFIRDTLGEKPTNQVEVKNTDIEDLTPLATLLKPKKEQEQDTNNDDN